MKLRNVFKVLLVLVFSINFEYNANNLINKQNTTR